MSRPRSTARKSDPMSDAVDRLRASGVRIPPLKITREARAATRRPSPHLLTCQRGLDPRHRGLAAAAPLLRCPRSRDAGTLTEVDGAAHPTKQPSTAMRGIISYAAYIPYRRL